MKRVAAMIVLLALVGAHFANAQDLPTDTAPLDVDSCIQRLDPQVDIGYDRIAARCPDLARQLEQSAWSAWLPRGWKESGNDLSAGGLKELRELAGLELGTRATGRTPDVQRLRGVLAELGKTGLEHGGSWARFKTWLRSVLESREHSPGESWLSRMIAHVGFSQSMLELISYAALALVVALAGAIVVNELRTAGLLSADVLRTRGRKGARTDVPPVGLSWGEVERASLRERPRLLLGLIAARLGDLGCLPPAGALTVRELTRAARLTEADDRSRLADLALVAERVRFSGRDILPERLEEPLARGRELLDRLNAQVAVPRVAGRTHELGPALMNSDRPS